MSLLVSQTIDHSRGDRTPGPWCNTQAQLAAMLADARARTLRLIDDLSDEQLVCPRLPIVNSLLWELGHVAWFQEKWLLRHLRGAEPLCKNTDGFYDSAHVPHDRRWQLPLPRRAQTLQTMQRVLERVLEHLDAGWDDEALPYFAHLAAFHEDMHGEAFVYTRQTLGYPPPLTALEVDRPVDGANTSCAGDVAVPGGMYWLGGTPDLPFVFDNEKWAHPVRIAPFQIARTPVTNGQFAQFVGEDGYKRSDLWSPAGWAWRDKNDARCPVYWRAEPGGRWLMHWFDRVVPLKENHPVMHVNWFEADAYCRWAKRRLPSEAEWEMAAATCPGNTSDRQLYPWGQTPPSAEAANLDLQRPGCVAVSAFAAGDSGWGCRQMIGNVWQWTADDFAPYPGFTPDAYQEYSAPWFGGTHKVLRGGAFATRSRLVRNSYRNFYTPDRRDVLAGFRTCSL